MTTRIEVERGFVMKRLVLLAVAAAALFVPTAGSAQGMILVYRHELRGIVAVPAPYTPGETRVVETVAPTPEEVIARHEAMAVGLRANANARGGAAVATDHCDRLIAAAREEIRRSF
jgi:hypothetical protein